MRRASAVFLALVALSSAFAQTTGPNPVPIKPRVNTSVNTWTQSEILSEFGNLKRSGGTGGSIARTLPKAGNFVKWGGGVLIGAAVVSAALDYFYNEVKRQSGTNLDNMYSTNLGTAWEYGVLEFPIVKSNKGVGGVLYYSYEAYANYFRFSASSSSTQDTIFRCEAPATNDSCFSQVEQAKFEWASQRGISMGSYSGKTTIGASFQFVAAKPTNPPLSSYLTDGASTEAVKNAVNEYLNAHPERIPSLLSPTPNANQIADDVVDPGLNTDAPDPFTDGDETRRGPGVTTNPGNRPHPGDGPATDPTDPASSPVDTDGDHVPDWRDGDDDNDGAPDDEETPDGQKDPKIIPESYRDTDGDGQKDSVDPDDDNDGFTDQAEETAGSDPKDKEDTPADKPCSVAGEVRGSDGTCGPPKEPDPCPTGETRGADGQCAPDPEPCPEGQTKDSEGNCKPDGPVSNDCGEMGIARLLKYPGPYIRDVFIPCDDFADLVAPIVTLLKTKFPFSLASALSGWFNGAGSSASSTTALPTSIGPIPIDAGWLSPLWSLIKTLVGVALYAWFAYWLIDRYTARTQI